MVKVLIRRLYSARVFKYFSAALLLTFGITQLSAPIDDRPVNAAPVATRGVYKILDFGNTGLNVDPSKTDLRLVRNEAFDSLADATMILPAVTDGARGGEYDGSSGCALVHSDLWCWGDNTFGRLGDGTTNSSPLPKMVLENVKDFFSSTRHTCAVTTSGDLVCAGGTTSYATGFITSFSSPIATEVTAINDGGWPCITGSDEHLKCAGNFRQRGGTDRYVPSEWVWVDTGLKASGDVANGGKMPKFTGPGGSGNGWDQERVICAVHAGLISCTVMDPHTQGTSIPTFSTSIEAVGVTNVTNLIVRNGGFGSSEGELYAYADGLLYKGNRMIEYDPPTAFEPIGSMERPLGILGTPTSPSSCCGTAFLFESGIGTLSFDPLTKFNTSTSDLSNTIIRVTAQSKMSQIIPMDVSTKSRSTRLNARVRILAGEQPVIGATVSWKSADLFSSSVTSTVVPLSTDINGWIEVPNIATGPVTFEVASGVSGSAYLNKARSTVVVPSVGDIQVSISAPPSTIDYTLTLTSRDGQSIPSAVVSMVNLFRTNRTTSTSNGAAAWSTSKPVPGYVFEPACPQCFAQTVDLITGEDGKVVFTLYSTNRKWLLRMPAPSAEIRAIVDFVASYNDGTVNVETTGILDSTNQMIQLPVDSGVTLTSAREVAVNSSSTATISVAGANEELVSEEICDVLVTGGLWSSSNRFDQRSCTNGSIGKTSVGNRLSSVPSCSKPKTSKAKNKVTLCPRRSMFVRMRVPGKTGTKGICVVVAKKPCTTKQSVRYGVPKILQIGKWMASTKLISTNKNQSISATVAKTSRSICEVKSGRIVTKKVTGQCIVTVSARNKNRVFVYDVPVLIVR